MRSALALDTATAFSPRTLFGKESGKPLCALWACWVGTMSGGFTVPSGSLALLARQRDRMVIVATSGNGRKIDAPESTMSPGDMV